MKSENDKWINVRLPEDYIQLADEIARKTKTLDGCRASRSYILRLILIEGILKKRDELIEKNLFS